MKQGPNMSGGRTRPPNYPDADLGEPRLSGSHTRKANMTSTIQDTHPDFDVWHFGSSQAATG